MRCCTWYASHVVARDLHTITPWLLECTYVSETVCSAARRVDKIWNCGFQCHYHYYCCYHQCQLSVTQGQIRVDDAIIWHKEHFILWECHSMQALTQTSSNNNNNNNNRIQRRYLRIFTISSLHRELSPTCTLKRPGHYRGQIMCNTSSAHHMQHVVLHATWYERTAQL